MRRIGKVILIIVVILIGASVAGTIGLAAGIFLTRESVRDELQHMEQLQEEVDTLNAEETEEENALQDEIASLKEQIAELEAEKAAAESGNTTEYLQKKFYSDGKLYHVESEDWVFYSDISLETELGNDVIIVSPVKSQDWLKNGVQVYTCLSTEGFVYSTEQPNLTPIEEE